MGRCATLQPSSSFLHESMCLCVCVCVCVHTSVHIHVYGWGRLHVRPWVFSFLSILYVPSLGSPRQGGEKRGVWCGGSWVKAFSVQLSSVTQLCPTLCDPMNCSTPGLPVHHQLPEFTQTHVHQVSDTIQPSHPLSSPSPPAPNPSRHQGLFQ